MKEKQATPPKDAKGKFLPRTAPVIPIVSDGVLNQSTGVPSPSVDASLEVSPPSLENTIPETRAAVQTASQTHVLAKPARVQDGLDPLTIELTDGLPVAPVAPNIEAPAVAPTVAPKKKNSGLLVGLGLLVASAAVVGIVVLSGGRAGNLAPRLPVDGLK